MKILITGGSGLLGQYLNLELSKKHDILTLFNKHVGNSKEFNFSQVDITDFEKFKGIFVSFRPRVVIHAASVSSPAQASKLLNERVENINVTATKFIAELCHQTKTKLVYISTDLVYDGDVSSYLKENSPLKPVSLYAKSKLEGEKVIRNTFFNYIILRQSLLYGFGLNHSTNHFMESVKNIKEGKKVPLFTDQFRSPLSLEDSARMVGELLEKDVKEAVLNFGGRERLSRYDLFELAADSLNLDKSLLQKVQLDAARAKNRVRDVSLDIEKLKSMGIVPKIVSESFEEIKKKFED